MVFAVVSSTAIPLGSDHPNAYGRARDSNPGSNRIRRSRLDPNPKSLRHGVAKHAFPSLPSFIPNAFKKFPLTKCSIKEPSDEILLAENESLASTLADSESKISPALSKIYSKSQKWIWQDYSINYVKIGQGPPVVLVHGFGASIGHFRKNITVLSENYTVFAIDLLGLGASDKPLNYEYTIENWSQLLLDFLEQVVQSPAVLVGNSIGSLVVLLTSSESSNQLVKGSVLLNCAGGMNNKAITDDWRIFIALPIFWLIDWLLLRPSIASRLFNRVKSKENVRTVLQSVYCNKSAVDDELVEIISRPSNDEGALQAFVSIITGPPGPRPETLIPKINHPILLLWGDKDTFTPMDGPVGKYFQSLPEKYPDIKFVKLPNVGHCPHDDDPDQVHAELLPWVEKLHLLQN